MTHVAPMMNTMYGHTASAVMRCQSVGIISEVSLRKAHHHDVSNLLGWASSSDDRQRLPLIFHRLIGRRYLARVQDIYENSSRRRTTVRFPLSSSAFIYSLSTISFRRPPYLRFLDPSKFRRPFCITFFSSNGFERGCKPLV